MTNLKLQSRPGKQYDLEDRTLSFARHALKICQKIPRSPASTPIINQLVRSSSSVGANYREANEALSRKDFIHKMRISRKECKESTYWLELALDAGPALEPDLRELIRESRELRNILTAIINKFTPDQKTL